MLMTLGAALLLTAAPVKVAVPSFTVIGLDTALGEAWAERFITLLGKNPEIKLITARDIQQVLGLERQKQLLGCGDGESASCLTELAGALGVDAILSGTFAKSETSITATLRVLKAADGSQLAGATGRLKDSEALQDWLEAQAVELDGQLRTAFKLAAKPPPVAAASSAGSGFSAVRLVPGLAGLALAGGGVGCFLASKGSAATLATDKTLDANAISSTASTGRILEGAGLGLMIAGGVAIAASVAWMVAAPRGQVGVVFVPDDHGGTFAIRGAW